MGTPAKYQRQLLDQARQIYHQTPISDATVQAFMATPRHLFVQRYRERASKEWCEVNNGNLDQHLATLYADNPLTLFGEDDDNIASTMSSESAGTVIWVRSRAQRSPGMHPRRGGCHVCCLGLPMD